jgi:hypothetical protein
MPNPPLNNSPDHGDGLKLNNLDSNLSYKDPTGQNQNRRKSKNNSNTLYKGIAFDKRDKIWRSQLQMKDGKYIVCKFFKTEFDAAMFITDFCIKNYPEKYATLIEINSKLLAEQQVQ